jgi:hypothetical protein
LCRTGGPVKVDAKDAKRSGKKGMASAKGKGTDKEIKSAAKELGARKSGDPSRAPNG